MEVGKVEILRVENLSKVYGKGERAVKAIDQVSFSIDKGEFVAIIGPSGSGKSTLMHLIGGVDQPSSGKVFVDGTDIYELDETQLAIFRRRQIGLIYQFYNLLPVLTVEENITLPLLLDGHKVDQKQLDDILRTLQLTDRLNHLPNQLSGGQQQRVSIGRAVITNPALMLADEPTGNLDSKSSKDVMELFSLINEKFNTTILLVTHDPTAASYCDRVVFIRDGKLYSEIHKGDNRQVFFQKIIDTISLMGGNGDEFSAVRVP